MAFTSRLIQLRTIKEQSINATKKNVEKNCNQNDIAEKKWLWAHELSIITLHLMDHLTFCITRTRGQKWQKGLISFQSLFHSQKFELWMERQLPMSSWTMSKNQICIDKTQEIFQFRSPIDHYWLSIRSSSKLQSKCVSFSFSLPQRIGFFF